MITPDVGATSLGITSCYIFWRWLINPNSWSAMTAGCVIGLAQLTKTTWLVLYPLYPLTWWLWRWTDIQRVHWRGWITQVAHLVGFLLLSIVVINAGYAFNGSFKRLRDFEFVSQKLGGADSSRNNPGNLFTCSWMGNIRIPLPADYVLGIDTQQRDFDTRMWSYLRGEHRFGGWWYYYLYALAIKTPLGTLGLFVLGVASTFFIPSCSSTWRHELVLCIPLLGVLCLVSLQTGFNHHLRYVLPVFPLIFILASKAAHVASFKNSIVKSIVTAILVWSIASSLCVYPHSLSYFNELVGGPTRGHEHLIDSNIDWGQDLLYLKRWLERHPEAKPLRFAYFGLVDPRVAGIKFTLPPPYLVPSVVGEQEVGPRPGWYALSVSRIHGLRRVAAPDGKGNWVFLEDEGYRYFLRFRPVAMAGYSIYVYHIEADEANRVRKQIGLQELKSEEQAQPQGLNLR
jgi:hypothetical protein